MSDPKKQIIMDNIDLLALIMYKPFIIDPNLLVGLKDTERKAAIESAWKVIATSMSHSGIQFLLLIKNYPSIIF